MTQKPKAPKPFELYSQAKLPQLMEQGLTGLQARQMCHQNYKCLDAKKKLKWINRALKKESAYLVNIVTCACNLVDDEKHAKFFSLVCFSGRVGKIQKRTSEY